MTVPDPTPLSWVFLPQREGEINSDPFSDEFFAREELAAALVRESIQNSLDAARLDSAEPVRVRFSLGTSDERRLAPERAARWLHGLWPHLLGRNAGLPDPPAETEPLAYLLVEDFGTRGLGGDPLQMREGSPGSAPNDFFYFWRNLGRSGKHDADRGRWGLGKSVFPASGRLHTIFGLTCRAADGRALLYGQSVLGTHATDEGDWTSFGFFGQVRGAGGPDALALPVEEPAVIEEFRRDFGLARGEGEPGFSVVVLHPPAELLAADVRRHAIQHFFYPILAGDLVVEVVDADGSLARLTGETLREEARNLRFDGRARRSGENLVALMDMAAAVQAFPPAGLVLVPKAGDTDKPRWKDGLLPEPIPAGLQERFETGALVGFRVPVRVRPAGAPESSPTFFDVFLQRDETLKSTDFHFIRQGITITDVVKVPPRHRVRALLVAEDRPICRFLGDAENPAHTEWEERNRHFQGQYEEGVSLLRLVRHSPGQLTDYLLQAREGMDPNLLAHLFYLEGEQDPAAPLGILPTTPDTGPRHERGERPFSPFAVPEVQANHEPFVLERQEGGFVVRANVAVGRPPEALCVEVAYEVRRGDPFARYSPLDFDLSAAPLRVTAEGARINRAEANRLDVVILTDDFRLRVQGFDPRRDVRVRAFAPFGS